MSSGFDKDFNTILVDFEKRINERLDNQEYILKVFTIQLMKCDFML